MGGQVELFISPFPVTKTHPLSYYSIERGCPFEKEKLLSAVRNMYPCIHSRDLYGAGASGVASCRYRRGPRDNFGLHADENVERKRKNESCCYETSQIPHRHYKSNFQN